MWNGIRVLTPWRCWRAWRSFPCKEINYRGIHLREFDLDAALRRTPQLILVDELAHSNAPGCRHTKRYQDIEELFCAGMDVYTTVNAALESLNDLVSSITGVVVSERISDRVFDSASQVELVDIEPADLVKRLQSGRFTRSARASRPWITFLPLRIWRRCGKLPCAGPRTG